MNKISRLTLLAVVAVTLLFTTVAAAQETVTIPLSDLQQLRKLAADRDYQKGLADDRLAQLTAANNSVANWQGLYNAEKKRADEIQEGRVTAVKDAVANFERANFELHNQNTDLKREKRDLEDENIRLRSSRKYYFIAGLATGGAGGAYLGYQLGKGSLTIPGLSPAQANTPNRFGFTFKF